MMLKLIIVSLLIIISAVTTKAKPKPIDGRIIGGRDANIEDYPYQMAIIDDEDDDGTISCGCVLIHPKWLLTAGYCTVGYWSISTMTIRYSASNLSKCVATKLSKVISHPKFDKHGEDNNIALLELVNPLRCKNCVPIPLTRANPRSGENMTITGWGHLPELLGNVSSIDDRLKVATVPVYSFNDCKEYYRKHSVTVTDNMFCIRGNKFSSSDMGGPGVLNGHLFGIMAFDEIGAQSGAPQRLISVGKYLTWIEQVTGIRTV